MINSKSCKNDAPARAFAAGAFPVLTGGMNICHGAFIMLSAVVFSCFLALVGSVIPGSALFSDEWPVETLLGEESYVYGADDTYTTESFDVDITVSRKHVIRYDEMITVDFLEPHHGIYRYIPVQKKFYDIDDIHIWGGDYEDSYEYSGENENGTYGNEILQIGDAYRTFTGLKDYRIVYSLVCERDDDKNKDYLSADLLPTGWQTPIKSSVVTVTLPEKIDWDDLKLYTGTAGEKEDVLSDKEHFSVDFGDDGKTLKVKARNLEQGQGVTIQAELPEGYWTGVSSRKPLGILAAIIPMIIAIFMGALWLVNGKDPDVVKPVEFYPPDSITPAEVGYIVDGKIDNKDLSSMIIYFASRGYLDIRETAKGSRKYELVKKCEIPDSEPVFAVRLFGGLFPYEEAVEGQEQTADLDNLPTGFGDAVRVARDELQRMYDSGKKKMFTERSKSARTFGTVMTSLILPISISITAYANYMAFGLFGGIIPFILVLAGMGLINSSYDRRHSSARVESVGKFFGGLALSAVAGLIQLGMVILNGGSPVIGIIAIIALAAALFFEVFMWARTKENAMLYGKILGFRNFIATAEHQRLVALSDENPEYYYDIMPYAMVMGMSVAWAKKFENMKIPEPDWYKGTETVDLGRAVWYNNIADSCAGQFVSASSMMPDISDAVDSGGFFTGGDFSGGGFGGGSFSGGGFGGGGGGAW